MKVWIYEEKLNSGNTSLILNVSNGKFRSKRSLGIYFKTIPKNEEEKRDKREKLLIAKEILLREELKLLRGDYFIDEHYNSGYDFVEYANRFIENHNIKDKRKFNAVVKELTSFFGKSKIPCSELTENSLSKFAKVLENKFNGETGFGYFNKLKQILKAATSDLHFRQNPALNIRVKQWQHKKLEVLSLDELRLLKETVMPNEEVKRAFLFATRTGLRYVDCLKLKGKNIVNGNVEIVQSKTLVRLSVPLDGDALSLIGSDIRDDANVFNLPSHTSVVKNLNIWAENAGINKRLGFHTARRTFGTTLIKFGNDVSVVSKLLGHTSLVNTQRYVKVCDEMKVAAINKLPSISNNKQSN